MAENGDWILKIISGPHQGVEELLPEGRLVIGTSADCGIVLHDVLIAAQHLALTRKGATVTVESLEGRAYCQGRRVTTPVTVPAFSFLTAGTTHLVVGPANARWPLLSVADAPELEKDSPTQPAAASPATTPPADAAEAKPAAAPAAAPTAEQRRRAWWMAGFGGALLIVWLILWLVFKPAPVEPPRPGPKARAEKVLSTLAIGKHIKLEERGDQVLVSGYVDSDVTHRELIGTFRAEVPEASLRLWSTPRLVETARGLLAARKLNLTVAPGEEGELRISGSAPKATDWAGARQMLLNEVPGLQRITDNVTVPQEPAEASPGAAETAAKAVRTLTLVAMQTRSDAPPWVRVSDGMIYFAGARFHQVATFTGIEGAKARFEQQGRTSLFKLGDNLATLLPSPAPAAETAPGSPAPATRNNPPSSASTLDAPAQPVLQATAAQDATRLTPEVRPTTTSSAAEAPTPTPAPVPLISVVTTPTTPPTVPLVTSASANSDSPATKPVPTMGDAKSTEPSPAPVAPVAPSPAEPPTPTPTPMAHITLATTPTEPSTSPLANPAAANTDSPAPSPVPTTGDTKPTEPGPVNIAPASPTTAEPATMTPAPAPTITLVTPAPPPPTGPLEPSAAAKSDSTAPSPVPMTGDTKPTEPSSDPVAPAVPSPAAAAPKGEEGSVSPAKPDDATRTPSAGDTDLSPKQLSPSPERVRNPN